MPDTLTKYRSMRDFKSTPEPRGRVKKTKGRLFIVQKHDATRLHYDFRLELDGVLLSWAVTRGPSLNPADKRLAVHVEDHPVEYGGFEGVIPSGYGAGTVMLWDRGEWAPQGDPHAMLKKGNFKFVLFGERLKGGFALIRLKPKPGERSKRENWLLIKERDDWAEEDVVATDEWTKSVKTKRSLETIAKEGEAYKKGKMYATTAKAPKARKAKTRKTRAVANTAKQKGSEKTSPAKKPHLEGVPRGKALFVAPQLAKLVDAPPAGDGWIHEIKFDGYRIIAVVRSGKVTLWTRNRKDWTHKYGRIAKAVAELAATEAVLDGELVALDDKGEAAFSKMQAAADDVSIPLEYNVFDLLHLNGHDLTGLPLIERKNLLKSLLASSLPGLKFSDHILSDGQQVLSSACHLKLEGVISKQAASQYTSGRSGAWVKSKCTGNDEFIIGGFRKSDKRGRPFSSLLLGEMAGDKVIYRGRVGTGFDDESFATLKKKFASRIRATSPFEEEPAEARSGAVWLKPDLVAQIAFFEQTPDGHLRHPSYLGLREDKPAAEVTMSTRTASAPKTTRPKTPAGVRLTSPDKVLWPEAGLTKADLAAYYEAHADLILPHIKDRPLSVVRCPEGSTGECFFQKHHNSSTPDDIETVGIREKNGKIGQYLVIRTKKALVSAAQIGALELHVWGCSADAIEKPERVVFDLDPDEDLDFADVRAAAVEVRDVLASLGLKSFALLTGGKGIHVVMPIAKRNSWDEVKTFAHDLANRLAETAPDRYVANMSKKKRRGRIFLDYLRNERGSTAICPYSPRRKAAASMATPVSWDELPRIRSAAAFTLETLDRRLASVKGDPWKGYKQAARQTLSEARLKAMSVGT
jgi:bifunctional non-homologous end joining protein LigD